MIRLSIALFLIQAGAHSYTASIPVALARAGRTDAEIGALVGVAALVQIVAALIGGALIDRYGAMRLFIVGGLCYLAASGLLLFGGLDQEATGLLVVARMLQGIGFGFCVPAALSVIPRFVSVARRGVALATAGAAHNLAFVLMPPISIIILDAAGLDALALTVIVMVVAGILLAVIRPTPAPTTAESHLGIAKRRFGIAFRRSWLGPLGVTLLFVIHWGVISAYLPQRAEAVGANIGLFFAADGLFVLLGRVPAGWLADHVRPLLLVLVGLAMTAVAVSVLLLLTPTTEVLVAAGVLTGTGAAVIIIPLMLALTERSTDADRGSAFSVYSACFAGALALGSIGTAPLIDTLGFEVLLGLGLVALGLSAVVAIADRGLRTSAARATGMQLPEEASATMTP